MGFLCGYPLENEHDNETSLFSIGHTVDGSEILHHRLDVLKKTVNNGISTTNLNWFSRRISEPSTVHLQAGSIFQPAIPWVP